jgi:hypothetical protein
LQEPKRLWMGQAARQRVQPLDVTQYHVALRQLYTARSVPLGRVQREPVMDRIGF